MTLYDPLTYDNLMAGLVVHFEKQSKVVLDEATGIEGPGIYAPLLHRQSVGLPMDCRRGDANLCRESSPSRIEEGR